MQIDIAALREALGVWQDLHSRLLADPTEQDWDDMQVVEAHVKDLLGDNRVDWSEFTNGSGGCSVGPVGEFLPVLIPMLEDGRLEHSVFLDGMLYFPRPGDLDAFKEAQSQAPTVRPMVRPTGDERIDRIRRRMKASQP